MLGEEIINFFMWLEVGDDEDGDEFKGDVRKMVSFCCCLRFNMVFCILC